jgi:hypothetical protein
MIKNLVISIVFLSSINELYSQVFAWDIQEVSSMPIAISNNAVTEGWANDTGYVYSFGGIDTTKIWSGINKKSFRYNTVTDVWDTIPDLPNTNAVIAAGASYVDSIIYIMGGYQVLSNGSEISSNIVNRFDPRTNTYMSDGATIPLATDDHVQAVWNDSLIYVITGWSNTGNIPNVQIYDPANNSWIIGTAVPNNNLYKAFGASGTIIGNTIYYHGGAVSTGNFPGQSTLRIGQIDPNNPSQITWSTQTTSYISYRAISLSDNNWNQPHFIGGSDITYNFNGVAYNGSGGVAPNNRAIYLNNTNNVDTTILFYNGNTIPMDLRGVANFMNDPTPGNAYITGGMTVNQTVSNKTFKLIYTPNVSDITENSTSSFKIYPNPTSQQINLAFKNAENKTISLIDVLGNEVFQTESNSTNLELNVVNYPKGIYFIQVKTEKEMSSQKIVIQ